MNTFYLLNKAKKIALGAVISITSLSLNAQIFSDDFESGNVSKWTNGSGTYSTRAVTTTDPAAGTYACQITGGDNNYWSHALYANFASSQPTEISWKLKIPDLSKIGGYVQIGNSSSDYDLLFTYHLDNKGIRFFNFDEDYYFSISANTWYKIEVKNINWTNKTFDIYIDGVLKHTSFGFINTDVTSVSQISLTNYSSGSTAYFDDIFIGEVCKLNINSLASNNNPSSLGCRNCAEITVDATGTGALSYVWSTMDTTKTISVCPTSMTDYKVIVTDSLGCIDSAIYTQNVIDARSTYPNRAVMCYTYPRKAPMDIQVYQNQIQQYLNAGATCGRCDKRKKHNEDISFEGMEDIYNIYPNPTQNEVTVEWFNLFDETVKIELVDLSGRVVSPIFEGEVIAGESSLITSDLTVLPAGMYFMRYTSPSDIRINKVQLMR
jgi:hypothetical protein